MYTPSAFDRKISSFSILSPSERKALADLFGRPKVYSARQELIFEAASVRRAFMIEEGWAYTYKILPDGSRQVVEVGIAGDILGLCGLQLRRSDLLAATVTPAILREMTAGSFAAVLTSSPRLAAAILWSGALGEGMIVEHLVDVGRRSAVQRVAHFMLELQQRLKLVLLGDQECFKCPLSQPLIADALGLTAIHMNRTLRELRTAGLLVMHGGIVKILDRQRLARLAGYDPTYLDPLPLPTAPTAKGRQAQAA